MLEGEEAGADVAKGKETATGERRPANLVFLIDVSGSMDQANKLPLLQSSFKSWRLATISFLCLPAAFILCGYATQFWQVCLAMGVLGENERTYLGPDLADYGL